MEITETIVDFDKERLLVALLVKAKINRIKIENIQMQVEHLLSCINHQMCNIPDSYDMFLDLAGIPKDNTVEDEENGYCRDYVDAKFREYMNGDIDEKQLLEIIMTERESLNKDKKGS